jgi:phospholipase D1/2
MKAVLAAAAMAAIFAGIAVAWRSSALSGFADVAFVASVISHHAQSPFAPLLAVEAFVLGGLVVFPVLVLIVATAAALAPWTGFFSASVGTLLSGLLLFSIARALDRTGCSACSANVPGGSRTASSAKRSLPWC